MPPVTKKLFGGNLTWKQERFKNEIVKQVSEGKSPNLTQAAMVAYNVTNKNVAKDIGSDNLSKAYVRESIEQALTKNGLTPSLILGNMAKLANRTPETKLSGETILRANVELAKTLGMYPDKKSLHFGINVNAKIDDMSFDDAKKELAKMGGEADSLVADVE